MKKPILGIIAVFCLQLGFIAYSTLDPAVDTEAVPVVARATQAPAQLEDDVDSIVAVRSGGPVAEDRVVNPKMNVARKSVLKGEAAPPKPAQPKHFIADRLSAPYRQRTEYPQQSPQKRSFATKALPVIKKPYDWVKAVAGIFR